MVYFRFLAAVTTELIMPEDGKMLASEQRLLENWHLGGDISLMIC